MASLTASTYAAAPPAPTRERASPASSSAEEAKLEVGCGGSSAISLSDKAKGSSSISTSDSLASAGASSAGDALARFSVSLAIPLSLSAKAKCRAPVAEVGGERLSMTRSARGSVKSTYFRQNASPERRLFETRCISNLLYMVLCNCSTCSSSDACSSDWLLKAQETLKAAMPNRLKTATCSPSSKSTSPSV